MSNNKPLNKIEIIAFNKYINKSFINLINKKCLELGLKGININGIWMSQITDIADKIITNLNIDCPFSQNDTQARISLINSYTSRYKELIDGINVGPVYRWLEDEDWDLINKDLDAIGQNLNTNKLNGRFIISLRNMKSDEQVLRLANLAITNGFKEVIIGTTETSQDCGDIILVGRHVSKDLSNLVSIFGNFTDQEFIDRGCELFNSVILPPLATLSMLERV